MQRPSTTTAQPKHAVTISVETPTIKPTIPTNTFVSTKPVFQPNPIFDDLPITISCPYCHQVYFILYICKCKTIFNILVFFCNTYHI